VITWSLLGVVCSKRLLRESNHYLHPDLVNEPVKRYPLVLIWIISAVSGFSLANQYLPASIEEDSVNKPWRPIPSGRVSATSAARLRWIISLSGLVFSLYAGGQYEFILQIAAVYWYNDLDGSKGWFIRNILNAIGLTSWLFGCINVAGGTGLRYTKTELSSAGILILAVTTTMSIQDFRDLEGDRASGRRTLPILLGETPARIVTSVLLLAWSFGIAMASKKSLIFTVMLELMGAALAAWLVLKRSKKADKAALQLWYVWFAGFSMVAVGA